ncbi:MAG: hypothetical protein ABIH70_09070 [Chloroflexota bacterium]
MRKEFRERLAKEYRFAADRMAFEKEIPKKLFYFSVLFGEAQRVLNWDWDRDLSLLQVLAAQVHAQVSGLTATNGWVVLPIKSSLVFEQLTKITRDLAAYFEQSESKADRQELYRILGRLAEVSYASTGNGSHLFERGLIKF